MKTAKDYLQEMTLEEKEKLTAGHTNWNFFGNERLGLPELMCADGPHGLRAYNKVEGHDPFANERLAPTTMFPIAAAMSSTFNPALLYQVGQAIGEECNMHHVDLLLAPGINLKRSPLGGRNFEYYSEDPYVTGIMASAYVNGVQSTGVGATIKHFALNEQENQRRFLNTIVDERTFHEMYLRPFYYTIKHANPYAIMSSYNQINGHYAGESKELLKDILREKWGYEGLVISDWGGVQHKVKSIKNGMNIEMPGPSEFQGELHEAILHNRLTEQELDASLLPLFHFYERTLENKNKGQLADLDAHHTIAYNVAKEAIVLLENDGILPLKKGTKIAVIGDFAQTPRINGGGSATLRPYKKEQPLEELEKVFVTTFAKGYFEEDTNPTLLEEVQVACATQDVIVYFTGTTTSLETEGKDREHMQLPEGHIEVLQQLKTYNKPIIVILNNGSAINVSPLKNTNAVVESWLLGGANAKALVEVLTGDVNPSGRLSETFPLCIENTPHYGIFPAKEDQVYYQSDIIKNGYRYYDTHKLPVKYPFGYGLSYSTFKYSNLELSQKEMTDQDTLTVSLKVTNTSTIDGFEVVQVYVHDQDSYYPRPFKELRGFIKVFVKANETKKVTILLDQDAFSVYSDDVHEYRVETGIFTIMVGSNVESIHLSEDVYVTSTESLRNNITLEHPLKNFKMYKPNQFKHLEDEFGTFAWYNIEEPAIRVLKRLKRHHNLSEEVFESWKNTLLE